MSTALGLDGHEADLCLGGAIHVQAAHAEKAILVAPSSHVVDKLAGLVEFVPFRAAWLLPRSTENPPAQVEVLLPLGRGLGWSELEHVAIASANDWLATAVLTDQNVRCPSTLARQRTRVMIPFPEDTEALLFDCDGTLVDSMPIHVDAWQVTLRDYGVDLPKSFIDARAGMPTEKIVEQMNIEFGVSHPVKIVKEKEARYVARINEVEPVDVVLATAEAHRGRLPMAVASGSVRSIVKLSLETVGALHLFPVLVTADDPIPGKPAPDIFLEAARQLHVEPAKCHVFEDGDQGIAAARTAGMTWTDVRLLV